LNQTSDRIALGQDFVPALVKHCERRADGVALVLKHPDRKLDTFQQA
jgi:hypothetical protein